MDGWAVINVSEWEEEKERHRGDWSVGEDTEEEEVLHDWGIKRVLGDGVVGSQLYVAIDDWDLFEITTGHAVLPDKFVT